MFRITHCMVTARTLLYRRTAFDCQLVSISRTPPQLKYKDPTERETCPPPLPPPPPKPKDDKLLWGAVTLLFLAGGFVVYAHETPEVRDWLSINAPWFDDLIAVIYQENVPIKESIQKFVNDTKTAFIKFITEDPNKPKSCEKPVIIATPDPTCRDPNDPQLEKGVFKSQVIRYLLGKRAAFSAALSLTYHQWNPFKTISKRNNKSFILSGRHTKHFEENKRHSVFVRHIISAKPKICKQEEPCPHQNKSIFEIDFCIKENSETTLNNYITARDATLYYNKLVMDTMGNFTMVGMSGLADAKEERDKLVKDSLANACESNSALEKLVQYLDCGVKAPKDQIQNTKQMLAEYRNKIDTVFIEYQWANDLCEALAMQVEKVMETLTKYTEANTLMFSGLDYNSHKPVLKGDPDLLMYQTLRYIEKLKVELKEAAEAMTDRVNRAFAMFTLSDKGKKDMNAYYSKRKGEMDKDYQNRLEAQKQDNENLLKKLLKKQLEKHEDTVQLRLLEKEDEANNKLNQMVADKVAAEKKLFAMQLREMSLKLRVLEDKLEARLKAEREARRSQALWSAGSSLLAATRKGDSYVNVEKEIKAIEKAVGDGDKLVLTVLKAIPDSVREKGVVPESVLREKYHSMEKVAMSVALVEEEGAPLPVYFLSWIQSWLLFMKLSGIPQKEYDNPPKEPPKDMDTFDLLNRARFYVESGNLAVALQYLSALEGASRGAAATWTEAARSHLETRQAAEAVIAHAVALGLQYI